MLGCDTREGASMYLYYLLSNRSRTYPFFHICFCLLTTTYDQRTQCTGWPRSFFSRGQMTNDGQKNISSEDGLELEQEYWRLKEARICKVCMDAEVSVVFIPCGHLICCLNCAPSLKNCPMCRQSIQGTVKTYMS